MTIGDQQCLLPASAVAKVELSLSGQKKRFEPSSAESQYAFRRAANRAKAKE